MELNLNRRQFVAAGTVAAMGAMAGLAGCSSSDAKTDAKTDDKKVEAPEKLVFAWEPGASEGKYENMRDLIAEAIAVRADDHHRLQCVHRGRELGQGPLRLAWRQGIR